jgi:hypothetical protein
MTTSTYYYATECTPCSSYMRLTERVGDLEDGGSAETEAVRHAPAGTELVVDDCDDELHIGDVVRVSEDGRITGVASV